MSSILSEWICYLYTMCYRKIINQSINQQMKESRSRYRNWTVTHADKSTCKHRQWRAHSFRADAASPHQRGHTVPGVSLPEYQYPGEDVEERMRDTDEEVDLWSRCSSLAAESQQLSAALASNLNTRLSFSLPFSLTPPPFCFFSSPTFCSPPSHPCSTTSPITPLTL